MTWYVYILECGDGSLYTGITDNLARRFAAHRAGRGAKYTRGRGPLTLVWHAACTDRAEASRREAAIKRLPRTKKLALIASEQTSEASLGHGSDGITVSDASV